MAPLSFSVNRATPSRHPLSAARVRSSFATATVLVATIACTPSAGSLGGNQDSAVAGSSTTNDPNTSNVSNASNASSGGAGTGSASTGGVDSTGESGHDTGPEPGTTGSAETTGSPPDTSTTDGGSTTTDEPLDCRTPTPTAETLPAFDCACEPQLQSTNSDTASNIDFVNDTGAIRRVYWLGYTGMREFPTELAPGESVYWSTFETHPWLITDDADQCITIFMPLAGMHEVSIP